jgi:hypothetical protein
MPSITGAKPLQLQGFAADDVYDTDPIESAEFLMGVDGKLSAGWVAVAVKQNYKLQADSPSIPNIFDVWFNAQQAVRDLFPANGVILLTAIGKKFTMTRGFLNGYKPLPDAKKLLQPQTFSITWESVQPAVA